MGRPRQGIESDLVEVALTAGRLPVVDLVVGVLDFDDGSVDQNADRDSDAGQRHEVRVETHHVHGYEGEGHAGRDREDGDRRRRDMPEKENDDERNDDDLFDHLALDGVDCLFDQFGTIVGCDNLDAFGQRRLEFLELRLHALDDIERVLSPGA